MKKLTPDELTSLATGIYLWNAKAMQNQVTYHCGPTAPQEKISVYFAEGGEHTPPEVVSAVKQRVRAIRDVEITFNERTADVYVSLLAIANENQAGRQIGYTASVTTASACEGSWGTDTKWSVQFLNNHVLYIDPTASGVAEAVVAALDAHDFEGARKSRALFKPKP
ncbi:MAG TPA: hypothetical protein VKW06_08905 [Candidatus Angelobacter sp.]|nr:hypothetical protein [Candidatus Angelobacter sp.]